MRFVAVAITLIGILVCSTTARPSEVLSTCELIQHLNNWEGKRVTVRGAVIVLDGVPFVTGTMMMPQATEHCRYADSKYVSADEPPQILLEYPEASYKGTHFSTVAVHESSFAWAADRLLRLQAQNRKQALVTVDGYVSLRKYNLRELERKVATAQYPVPKHTFPPVILTLVSYRSVE